MIRQLTRILTLTVGVLATLTMVVPAQIPNTLPLGEVVTQLSMAQHRGSWFRDRSVYFQRLYVERYKDQQPDGTFEDRFYRRQSTAEVSADKEGEVIAHLVADTDSRLRPKRVSGSSRLVFGAPAFLELIFFPMYPENVKYYQVTDLGTTRIDGQEMRILRFFPKEGAQKPLVEGVFYVNPETGHPLKLSVDRLHNFDQLDKKLDKLMQFQCDVTYRTLPNGVTVPYRARGKGNSRVIRYKGYFQFTFEEWGYHPNPLYPEVDAYYAKMKDFKDEGGDATPPDLMIEVKDLKDTKKTENSPQTGANGGDPRN